jgi:ribonuclease HI
MTTKFAYQLYFDGASRSNPGEASYGGVIYENKDEKLVYGKYVGVRTNNEVEYMGLLNGLKEAVKMNIKNMNVFGDSKLVIEQVKGNWKVKSDKLRPYYDEIKQLLSKNPFENIEFEHVYRKNNKRADQLANIALDEKW